MSDFSLVPCKEERFNCPLYDSIDTVMGALDADEEYIEELEDRIRELEDANDRLSGAMMLLCGYFSTKELEDCKATLDDKNIDGQMSLFDMDPCYGCPGCEYNDDCPYEDDMR